MSKKTPLETKILQAKLQDKLPKGVTIYTVRKSNRSHSYILLCIVDGCIHNITSEARVACGHSQADTWSVAGYNYNHARSIVEELGQTLYGDVAAFEWVSL